MRKILTLILILFCVFKLNAQTDTLKVLFIGNSYTYFNDLPSLFTNLAQADGKNVVVQSSAFGGYSFSQHATNSQTLAKISQEAWDYVVLQEQSQMPTIDYYRYNFTYPYARFLDSLITLNNSKTAFFMTWGRKFGGQQCINSYCSPVFADFFQMQDTLKAAYSQIADELSATLCPVGLAWKLALTLNPSVSLWNADNSHPSLEGSYLATCVFYSVFFGENPTFLPYTAGLSTTEAQFFQSVAFQTVTKNQEFSNHELKNFELSQNFPNPFNPSTKIFYKTQEKANLTIFNLLGEKIREFDLKNPNGFVDWDGTNLEGKQVSSGIYFYRLQSKNFSQTKKMSLIK